jgi:NTP pyrophosphatase (non-canonical NTP hydrolase)
MEDLGELRKIILKFRDERDWKQFHNPKDSAISLLLESAEFLEHFQWKNDQEIKQHVTKEKDEVSDELADVLFWVILIANDLGIDLVAASKSKMRKNEAKYPVEKARGNHTKYTQL